MCQVDLCSWKFDGDRTPVMKARTPGAHTVMPGAEKHRVRAVEYSTSFSPLQQGGNQLTAWHHHDLRQKIACVDLPHRAIDAHCKVLSTVLPPPAPTRHHSDVSLMLQPIPSEREASDARETKNAQRGRTNRDFVFKDPLAAKDHSTLRVLSFNRQDSGHFLSPTTYAIHNYI